MRGHPTWMLALLASSGIVAPPALAAEVVVTNPTISGRPVDRCIREGAARCEARARERVADETCQNRGFADAIDNSATYQGGFPRSVSIFDDRLRRFVAGLGADTITRVTCRTPEPVLTLTAPANGTTVAPAVASRTATIAARFSQVATTLSWSARNLITAHSIVGCLQRSQSFDDNRFECNAQVLSWSGDFRLTSKPIMRSEIASHAGTTLYWSVRACERTPTGTLVANGERLACTDWATPRSIVVEEPPPAVTFARDLLPVFQSERCVRCHEAYPNRSMPPWHVNGPSGWPPSGSCVGCHSVQRAGVANWQGPANNTIEFRNKSPQQLCQMAQTGTQSHPDWREHLTEDPLILWAIGTARVPSPGSGTGYYNATRAFNGTVAQWIDLVNRWASSGASCQ